MQYEGSGEDDGAMRSWVSLVDWFWWASWLWLRVPYTLRSGGLDAIWVTLHIVPCCSLRGGAMPRRQQSTHPSCQGFSGEAKGGCALQVPVVPNKRILRTVLELVHSAEQKRTHRGLSRPTSAKFCQRLVGDVEAAKVNGGISKDPQITRRAIHQTALHRLPNHSTELAPFQEVGPCARGIGPIELWPLWRGCTLGGDEQSQRRTYKQGDCDQPRPHMR